MKDDKVDHKRLQSSFINFGKFNSSWKFVLAVAAPIANAFLKS